MAIQRADLITLPAERELAIASERADGSCLDALRGSHVREFFPVGRIDCEHHPFLRF